MRKALSFLTMIFFMNCCLLSQVQFEDKSYNFKDSYFEISIRTPFFKDTSLFFKQLNKTIFEENWTNIEDPLMMAILYNKFCDPNFEDFTNPDSSIWGLYQIEFKDNSISVLGPDISSINYVVLQNSETLLNFNIESSQHGDYLEQYEDISNYVIDLRNKTFLTIDSFFSSQNKRTILASIKKEFNTEGGFENTNDNPDNNLLFQGIGFKDSTIVFYYSYNPREYIASYTSIERPLKEMLKYIRPKRKLLVKSIIKG